MRSLYLNLFKDFLGIVCPAWDFLQRGPHSRTLTSLTHPRQCNADHSYKAHQSPHHDTLQFQTGESTRLTSPRVINAQNAFQKELGIFNFFLALL